MVSSTTIPMHPIPGRKHYSIREPRPTNQLEDHGFHQSTSRVPMVLGTLQDGNVRLLAESGKEVANNGLSCREMGLIVRQASGKTSMGIHRWIGIKSL